jgi:protein SCO1/2
MPQTPQSSSSSADPDPGPTRSGALQKIITISLWSILLLVVLTVLVGKFFQSPRVELGVLFVAPKFTLIDQEGRSVSSDDLRGKAYVCDFIFTTCGSACPLMSHEMAEIQQQTPPQIQLVSFTVNPEHDTPAVLREYAASYGADLSRWHFLTGTREQMSQVAVNMKIQKPDEPNPTVAHSERFFLVDGDGDVRGIYSREDPEAMKALIANANWLAWSKGGHGW